MRARPAAEILNHSLSLAAPADQPRRENARATSPASWPALPLKSSSSAAWDKDSSPGPSSLRPARSDRRASASGRRRSTAKVTFRPPGNSKRSSAGSGTARTRPSGGGGVPATRGDSAGGSLSSSGSGAGAAGPGTTSKVRRRRGSSQRLAARRASARETLSTLPRSFQKPAGAPTKAA